MKKVEISEPKASRELDAIVEEIVFGIHPNTPCLGDMYNEDDDHWSCTACAKTGSWNEAFPHTRVPLERSSYIIYAWPVVGKMQELGWSVTIHNHRAPYAPYTVEFSRAYGHLSFTAEASTIELAICAAAIAAITGHMQQVYEAERKPGGYYPAENCEPHT